MQRCDTQVVEQYAAVGVVVAAVLVDVLKIIENLWEVHWTMKASM